MSMDIEKLIKYVAGAIGAAFTVWFLLEAKYWMRSEAEIESAELKERILMSESTRYAEIAKYYQDKLANGEVLTQAEQDRLALVQRQQMRINQTLTKDD